MPILRALALSLLLVAAAIPSLVAATPSAAQEANRGETPVSIRIPQALVDTSIEPREIQGGQMQASTGPWVVSWYKESGRLGVPGHAVMTGLYDAHYVGAAVFYFLEYVAPNDQIEVTGRDGNLYVYRIDSVETYPLETFPITDIFTEETGAEVLTLFTAARPFDVEADAYANVLVVRASRQSGTPAPWPDRSPAIINSPDGCPVDPHSLPLLVSTTFPASQDPSERAVTGPASAGVVATLDALLGDATACDLVARSTLVLADGTVRTLVCPAGDLPLDALQFVLDDTLMPVFENLATLCAFLRFVNEDGVWRAAYLGRGSSDSAEPELDPDVVLR